MSTNFIFRQPGRIFNYTPADANATKDEILKINSRGSFSTLNEWPLESPIAGYYDIKNTQTKLILYNNRNRPVRSHLRGQVKPKKISFKDQRESLNDGEGIEETVDELQEKIKTLRAAKPSLDSYRVPHPDRHFMAMGCTHRPEFEDPVAMSSMVFTNKTSSTAKSTIPKVESENVPTTADQTLTEDESSSKQTFSEQSNGFYRSKKPNKDLLYYLYYMNKATVGFQNTEHKNAPKEFKRSVGINHPDIDAGQKLYLYDTCRAYSVKSLKDSKQRAYFDLLEYRVNTGLHDHEDPNIYIKYIADSQLRKRPNVGLNLGYFTDKPARHRRERPQSSNSKLQLHSSITETEEFSLSDTKPPRSSWIPDGSTRTVMPLSDKSESKTVSNSLTMNDESSFKSVVKSTSQKSLSTSSNTIANNTSTSSKNKSVSSIENTTMSSSSSSSNSSPVKKSLTTSGSSQTTSTKISINKSSSSSLSTLTAPTSDNGRPRTRLSNVKSDEIKGQSSSSSSSSTSSVKSCLSSSSSSTSSTYKQQFTTVTQARVASSSSSSSSSKAKKNFTSKTVSNSTTTVTGEQTYRDADDTITITSTSVQNQTATNQQSQSKTISSSSSSSVTSLDIDINKDSSSTSLPGSPRLD